jgi:putative oxidoreductase
MLLHEKTGSGMISLKVNDAGWIDRLGQPLAFLALRLYLGGFLIWGVWDNITEPGRMIEFAMFLATMNCPWPEIAAPVSVWAQLITGLLLIPGLFTRWAGALLSVNFLVAVVLFATTTADARTQYPHAILVFIGLVFMTAGAGKWAADAFLERRKG